MNEKRTINLMQRSPRQDEVLKMIRDMESIAIVIPCVTEKKFANATERIQAKDAYCGHDFAMWKRCAEESGKPWFILSSHYGLIAPDEEICDYEIGAGETCKNHPSYMDMGELQGQVTRLLGQYKNAVLLDCCIFAECVKTVIKNGVADCMFEPYCYPPKP